MDDITKQVIQEIALNAHLGAFEKKHRRYGASPSQVSRFLTTLLEDVDDVTSFGSSTSGDRTEKLYAIAKKLMDEKKAANNSKPAANLEDVVGMIGDLKAQFDSFSKK